MQVILKFGFAFKHYQIIVERVLNLYPIYSDIILCYNKFLRNRSSSMYTSWMLLYSTVHAIIPESKRQRKKNLN